MDLHQIEIQLQADDFQYRLKAVAALRQHPPTAALPLLIKHLQDPEFLVRSFIARELGFQKTSESFAALLQIMMFDNTPNVRAEAANSLSLFGQIAASHLTQTFLKDEHWLVRRSILAALVEMDCPAELFEVCGMALAGDDVPVQQSAVDALASLAGGGHAAAALAQLLKLSYADNPRIRSRVAYSLKYFDAPQAQQTLAKLRNDKDHSVVGAAMEPLLG